MNNSRYGPHEVHMKVRKHVDNVKFFVHMEISVDPSSLRLLNQLTIFKRKQKHKLMKVDLVYTMYSQILSIVLSFVEVVLL